MPVGERKSQLLLVFDVASSFNRQLVSISTICLVETIKKGIYMSLEQEQRTLERRQREMTDLQKRLAGQQSKLTAAEGKANAAQTAAAKARTESTRNSKLRSCQSALRDKERAQKEISSLQGKIAAKQKEVNGAAAKVERERQRIEKAAAKKRNQDAIQLKRTMGSISRTIEDHTTRLETLENAPEKVTVLYLGTSPEDEARIRIDAEARDIHEAIRKSDNPQCVDFNDRWAVRQSDLLQALNETNPDIVHFSGHGAADGSIVLEDQFGNAVLLDKERLSVVVGAAAQHVRLIVFNACYSDEEVEKILCHVDATIGMADSISDDAAKAFAAQLYSSIGFGLDLQTAFNQACAAIVFVSPEEIETPRLRVRDGLDADKMVFVG